MNPKPKPRQPQKKGLVVRIRLTESQSEALKKELERKNNILLSEGCKKMSASGLAKHFFDKAYHSLNFNL